MSEPTAIDSFTCGHLIGDFFGEPKEVLREMLVIPEVGSPNAAINLPT